MVNSKIGQAIQEAVRTELQNAIITSAGDPTRDINRVIDVIDTGAFEAIDSALGDAIQRSTKNNSFTDTRQLEDAKKQLNDMKKQLSEMQQKLANPQGFLEGEILDIIKRQPVGQAILTFVPIISAALASPEIINRIIKLLISPGGPFDRRLKIIIENNVEQFFSRQDQKRRQLGLDQVIYTGFEGFGNAQGRLTTNTLQQKKSTGTTEIGLNEVAIGLN